jgi:zinc transport system ATP-binding protein
VCEDLSFSYNRYPIVEDVNVTVHEREFVSIVGPNGGGKTTLLKLMLGLLHPSSGRVRIFGTSPQEARPRIGYMPQHAYLDPQFPVNVMDVVLMGRIGHTRWFGPYTRTDRECAEEALRELRMWEHRGTHFSALSGGQRQRVLIARALASQPDLLLLDEPTASLDLAVETELYELLRSLTERLTVVVVSHDIGFVSHYVTKVICVKQHVVVHPTSEITGEVINELYGSPMHMVRHNHRQ